MKRTLLSISLILFTITSFAQQTPPPKPKDPDIVIDESIPNKTPADTTKVYTAVEQEPSFRGGMANFFKYLQQNLIYPADAAKNRVEGRVFITFVVERDGSLSNVQIVRNVSPSIDAEALRVISASPPWKPGMQNGKTIRVQYTVPITFKLPPQETMVDPNVIFTAVEQEPRMPGGLEGFYNYLQKNLKYPEEAKKDHIHGKVFLSFIVEKDGSLSDIKVVRSIRKDLDVEATRLLRECPKWNPGVQNGRPVRVMYTMPINFELPE